VFLFQSEHAQGAARVCVFEPGAEFPLADSRLLNDSSYARFLPGLDRVALALGEGQIVRIEVRALSEGPQQAHLRIRPLALPRLHGLTLTRVPEQSLNGMIPPRVSPATMATLDPGWFYLRETSPDLLHWTPETHVPGSLSFIAVNPNPDPVDGELVQAPSYPLAVVPSSSGTITNQVSTALQWLGPSPLSQFIRYRAFLDEGGPRTRNFLVPIQPQ
jgi:hypothetical protein